MTVGKNLRQIRKRKRLAIEDVAKQCDIDATLLNEWERDKSVPDDISLDRLAAYYGLTGEDIRNTVGNKCLYKGYVNISERKDKSFCEPWGNAFHYEYVSKTKVFGLPIIHINIGLGSYKAKGIIAVGNIAQGIFSVGLLSVGVISLGIFDIGFLAIGLIALGGLSVGAIAVGFVAVGDMSAGYFHLGGLSVGKQCLSLICTENALSLSGKL